MCTREKHGPDCDMTRREATRQMPRLKTQSFFLSSCSFYALKMEDTTETDTTKFDQLEEQLLDASNSGIALLCDVRYGTDATFSEFDENGIAFLLDRHGERLPLLAFGRLASEEDGTKIGAAGTYVAKDHTDVS